MTCPGPSGARLTLHTTDEHPGPSQAERGPSFGQKAICCHAAAAAVSAESHTVARRLSEKSRIESLIGEDVGFSPSNAHFGARKNSL